MVEQNSTCIIEELIEKPFLERSKNEQLEIIKTGRPTPVIPCLSKEYHNTNRHYLRYEWLTGSEKLSKLFCWYCLLFEDSKQGKYLWASNGYSDIRQLVMAATRHALSQNHHKHMVEYQEFQENIQTNCSSSNQVKQVTKQTCIINQILGSPFLQRSTKEQLEIFHNSRPTPPMPLLFTYDFRTNTKMVFKKENYEKYKWLAGSQKLNRLYCWKCLLFADPSLNEQWISIGFNKMEEFEESVSSHQRSCLHKHHEIKYDDFNKTCQKFEYLWNEDCSRDENSSPDDDLENFLTTELQRNGLVVATDDTLEDIDSYFESLNSDLMDVVVPELDENSLNDKEGVIQKMLTIRFPKLSEDVQKQILSVGRPVPDASKLLKLEYGYYNKYNWLTANVETMKYYCWFCLLFKEPYENNLWGQEGIPYAKDLPRHIENHTKSNLHVICTSKYLELTSKFEISSRPLKMNRLDDKTSSSNSLEKHKDDNCIVIQLLRNNFEKRPYEEQKMIIQKGRPTPNFRQSKSKQSFTQYYQKYEWLCGSQTLNKLFCWYCLLFGNTSWGCEGVSNFCKITDALKKHDGVASHAQCLKTFRKFGKVEEQLEETIDVNNSRRCLIHELLEYPFCDRPLQKQIEIVRKGRPTPGFNGVQFLEKFPTVNYLKFTWLAGSQKLKKLFCWSCLLFGESVSANKWALVGFDNISNISIEANKHETSNAHLKLFIKLIKFKSNYCNDKLLNVRCETISTSVNSV